MNNDYPAILTIVILEISGLSKKSEQIQNIFHIRY